jgi:hypothetical protein
MQPIINEQFDDVFGPGGFRLLRVNLGESTIASTSPLY